MKLMLSVVRPKRFLSLNYTPHVILSKTTPLHPLQEFLMHGSPDLLAQRILGWCFEFVYTEDLDGMDYPARGDKHCELLSEYGLEAFQNIS